MIIPSIERLKVTTVIFDLDGTLIDSASSILVGLNAAMKKSGLIPVVPLTLALVGPPLEETLRKLVDDQSNIDFNILLSDFKDYYDSGGFKASVPYPGTQKLLDRLTQLKLTLYLATNKRLEPTLKIVDYFGWDLLFDDVYAIDKFVDRPFRNKASMIQALIQEKSIKPECAIYVGDRIEDFEACLVNGLGAILVSWGYGDIQNNSGINDFLYADTPEVLFQMIVGEL